MLKIDRDYEIYTDGACSPNPGKGGWAFVVYDQGKEMHSEKGNSGHTTNNRMELMAIKKALEWADRTNNTCTTIYTDSMLCVNSLTKWYKKWQQKNWVTSGKEEVKNKDILIECIPLLRNHKIKWVKGHAGIQGNERADSLARGGSSPIVQYTRTDAIQDLLYLIHGDYDTTKRLGIDESLKLAIQKMEGSI